MFGLVKHECDACMEERECVMCTRCNSHYCKEDILENNRVNNTVGLCPTCKTKYNTLSNYYIYGTNAVPILSTIVDKYRERIQSNDSFKLMQLYGDINQNRHELLHLYLNRLYIDNHQSESDILQTWANNVLEAKVVTNLFNEFCRVVNKFTATYKDNDLNDIIIRRNVEYGHDKWIYTGESHYIPPIVAYIKKANTMHPLKQYVYRDSTNGMYEVTVTERGVIMGDFTRGVCETLIGQGIKDAKVSSVIYKTIDDDNNGLSVYNLHPIEPISESANLADEGAIIHISQELGDYVVYNVHIVYRNIMISPSIQPLQSNISESEYSKEMRYYVVLANEISKRVNEMILANRQLDKPIDAMFYDVLYTAANVKSYAERVIYRDAIRSNKSNIKQLQGMIESLIEYIKTDTFNANSFLSLLNNYYLLSGKYSFVEDIKQITNAVKLQLFNDLRSADAFNDAILPLLTLNEHQEDTSNKSSMKQTTFSVYPVFKDVLHKPASSYKLSFIRCVCGGSVIARSNANPEGDNTVYECTRCHKTIDALPKQEIDAETAKLLESISKKCPVCGVYIQKAEGCNHMFCTNCKNGFNWNDLSKLDNRDNTNPHYREYRRGNVSNLRGLLDSYQFPADRRIDPIEWFGYKLRTEMQSIEKAINDQRESLGADANKFIHDDAFALKFINELNSKKIRKIFIQTTFDNTINEAFKLVNDHSSNRFDNRVLLCLEYSKLVTCALRAYERGLVVLDYIKDGISTGIDCAIEKARRISNITESDEPITAEMMNEETILKNAIIAQLRARIDEQTRRDANNTIVIGNQRIFLTNA